MEIEQLKNIVDWGVIGLLILLSVITLAVTIERILFFRAVDLRIYRHKLTLELDLTNRLGVLASIGSNAPYIGLLGTVLAIIMTFYIIGDKAGAIESAQVMKSLALALKATAMGLVVAIPATVIYNIFLTKVDRLLAKWEIEQDERGRYK
ncbi:MAG: biopolymer transporter ExbB [Sulfurovum sp. PC08-66]|jgi:biopolymer transport protein ExbB|nr:MAG: biopolymer transporter ExbB [Sulfurovum sp. PC08-66]